MSKIAHVLGQVFLGLSMIGLGVALDSHIPFIAAGFAFGMAIAICCD